MKKALSLLLAIMLTATLFTGAALGDAATPPANPLPLVENPGDVTLRFMVTEHPAIIDWSTNEFIKWMEKQTNVHIEFEGIPLEGRTEKVNLVLASGSYPDVFFGLAFSTGQIQQYGMEEHLLMPLNDLIDQYAPNTLGIFEEYPGSRAQITQLDGNIYSMPNANECYHCTLDTKMWINQTWLDNLNLKMPTTTDEFYEVLKAFKEQDANGNGDPNDELPLAGSYLDGWSTQADRFIMNSFLYYDIVLASNTTESFGFYMDGDTVKTPFADPAMKEGLRYIRKLYDEGLYYDGSFSQNANQLTQLVENPDACLVGAVGGGYGGIFSQLGGERYKQYRAVLPLKGPEGVQQTIKDPYSAVWASNFILSKDCANPEIAVKWADYCYEFESTCRAYLGPKDVNWRDAKEGEIGINGKPALYVQLVPWQEVDPQNDHIVQMGIDKRDSDYRLGMAYDQSIDLYSSDALEKLLYEVSVEYSQFEKPEMKLPPLKFTKAQNDEMMVMKTELTNGIREGLVDFMTGARDIDNDYDAFLDDLENKGLSKLTEYYQAAYDTQIKATK